MSIKDLNNRDAEVGFTMPGANYPGFVNVKREGDNVTVTVRGEARGDACGPLSHLTMTFDQWRGFFQNLYARL